jgi:hypothetical protein
MYQRESAWYHGKCDAPAETGKHSHYLWASRPGPIDHCLPRLEPDFHIMSEFEDRDIEC